jgi:hypothetical protein
MPHLITSLESDRIPDYCSDKGVVAEHADNTGKHFLDSRFVLTLCDAAA